MSDAIESVLQETRSFAPSAEFSAAAHISSDEQYLQMWTRAKDDPAGFWGDLAQSELDWFQPFDEAMQGEMPETKWFVGGKINASYQCLDRHLTTWRKNKAAIIWEGEDGAQRTFTYQQLHHEVCKFSNVLKKLGVEEGDRVTLYMPMVPELAIAMLACARIGATHSIIFGGFSADAISDRNNDAQSKLVITADGGWRRGKEVPLKANVDASMEKSPSVEKVVVVRRTGGDVTMAPDRDYWWHELMEDVDADCPATQLDSEHPLFILYTSGSTGKPKGVLHTTAGYMLGATMTTRWVFDLKDEDTYWCTADIGWITGHSYIVYGILPNRVPTLMYEGAPNFPEPDRFWDIVERHKVTKFYTAPTAIRAFMKWGDDHPRKHDLSSLKVLGTVGEPINPEAWMWYHKIIGNEQCPIVDTWWQTETGGHMMTPLPGATTTVPGSCTLPFFGVDAAVGANDGNEVGATKGGLLVIRKPWPSMMRGIYGDRERFIQTYWSTIEGCYLAGDSARRDEDGNFWIMGRIDDVINVSGHRLGTAEVESALVSHPSVAESAVVGIPHEIKGTGIAAFVTLRGGKEPTPELKDELTQHVGKEIGAIAKPDQIRFTDALPKTRSGKIMRRLLREVAAGGDVTGDTTTLEDFTVLAKLKADEE